MSVFSPDVNVDAINTPVPVELQDGSGNPISSTAGSLNTNVTNTVTISGTVTANLGTIDGAATAANQATQTADLVTIIAQQTNGSQHTIVDNFPADADALAQGSTTAGQLGALVMGAVTTTAPTYVTAKTNPLSLDTLGNLRVVATEPTSVTSTVVQITSTGANQILLAANTSRKKAILFFTSGNWNIKLGVGATATSFSYNASTANTTIEILIWTGEIDAICTTSGKLVNVTELS